MQQHHDLWTAFEITEREKHHFNTPTERLAHALHSLQYAHHLCSSLQRFDLALALVRAADTHLEWLWRNEAGSSATELIGSPTSRSRRDFDSSLRCASAAAMRLLALCEGHMLLSASPSSQEDKKNMQRQQNWSNHRAGYDECLSRGIVEDLSLLVAFPLHQDDDGGSGKQPSWDLGAMSLSAQHVVNQLELQQQQRQSEEAISTRVAVTNVEKQLGEMRRRVAAMKVADDGANNNSNQHLDLFAAHVALLTGQWRAAAFHAVPGSTGTDDGFQHFSQCISLLNSHQKQNNNNTTPQAEMMLATAVAGLFSSRHHRDLFGLNSNINSNNSKDRNVEDTIGKLLSALELVSSLCCRLEQAHTASPNRDTVLSQLCEVWASLGSDLATAVDSMMIRGQSRLRTKDVANWLERYRRELESNWNMPLIGRARNLERARE